MNIVPIAWIAAGMLVGNVLLASAFASYAGPFDMASRLRLVQDVWLPDLQQRAIPMTIAISPLDVLTSSSIKVVIYGTCGALHFAPMSETPLRKVSERAKKAPCLDVFSRRSPHN